MKQAKVKKLKRAAAMALAVLFLLPAFFPASACAEEAERKIVRVGYTNSASSGETHENEYKSGREYEYLQEISYITGWEYEYVYASFDDCMDMLANGEIDLLGNVTYTPEHAKTVDFPAYPQGEETYWLYTDSEHAGLVSGGNEVFNGCRIGVTRGTYQRGLLESWLAENDIDAKVVLYRGYEALERALEQGGADAIVTSDLSVLNDCIPVTCIGANKYYFAVSKQRPDLLIELNAALHEIRRSMHDYTDTVSRRYNTQNDYHELNNEELQWLDEHGNTIRLGLLSDNRPYSMQTEDGSVTGILNVLADNITDKLGITVESVFYDSSSALLSGLKSGEVDALGPVYSDYYFAEKNALVLTDELLSTPLAVVYNGSGFGEDDDIIVVSNETLMSEDVAKMLFPNNEVRICDSYEDCMEEVASGEADFMVVTSLRLNLLRQYPTMQNLQFSDLPVITNIALATTKGNRMATAVLNKGIALSDSVLTGSLLAQSSYVPTRVTWSSFIRDNIAILLIMCRILIVVFAGMAYLLYKRGKQTSAALEKAHEANAVKTEFLSRMSHDIRTPMNAVINLSSLAREENDITVVHEYLDKVLVSSDFLLGLINDILDMSKIESGELVLNNAPMTQEDVFNSVNTVMRPLMESKHINFHCNLSARKKPILVDKMRFNQIFFNLLSNAAKFTPEGGDVWFELENIMVTEDNLWMQFTVRDNGIGMSEEFLQHLYEPFAQEHSALSDRIKGTGFGLSIVKSLVDAMGGTITVKSKLGEGTEFIVTLYADYVKEEASAAPKEEKPDLRGLRILVVEDNEINTYVATMILEQQGCIVTTAENGRAALDKFAASEPFAFDAILMDVRMPVMDGLAATRAIRAMDRPDAASVPIIAMTADVFSEERKRTIEAGMNEHLSKPLEPKRLYAVLAACTQREPADCADIET